MSSIEASIRRLESIEQIKALKSRCVRAVDTKDWNAFAASFIPDVVVESHGTFEEMHSEPQLTGVDAVVALTRKSTEGFDQTLHEIAMPEIELTGDDEATGRWVLQTWRWPSDGSPVYHAYARYSDRYVRIDGQWRIARIENTRLLTVRT